MVVVRVPVDRPAQRQCSCATVVKATVQKAASVECEVVLAPTGSLTFTTSGKLSRAAAKADYLSGAIRDVAIAAAARTAASWSSSPSPADPRRLRRSPRHP